MRVVRSFVRRDGRLTAGQENALKYLWPVYGLEPHTPIDSICPKNKAVVLEIGFGTGDSLAQMATADPDNFYIGIEVHRPGVGQLLKLTQDLGLNNLRIYSRDAVEILQQCVPDQFLDKIQIFFPDPWPKKRHHKRRLIRAEFAQQLANKLKQGGLLHIATDWQDYAEHCVQVLDKLDCFANTAQTPPYVPRPPHRPLTKFEQRGQKLGHEVWDLVYETR